MWGANSESAGTNSITGVEGAAPAKGVKSDGMSNIGGTSEVGNYGSGFSAGGSGGSSVPNEAEEKKKKSKSFWKGVLKK
ncbi:hypothetical protein Taro_039941 [Colocasia esculenta]|uniref:Uncharacterized protein n=1 Tax=Colocasia esculenta TaxID=4460 RepID=A0A843WSZ4_COLES|nr:hypothetical protein [Colocasia esculenta]